METLKLNKSLKPKTQAAAQPENVCKIHGNFTELEEKFVADMKNLHNETIKLEIEWQRNIYKLEKEYQPKYGEAFKNRKLVLEEFRNNFGNANGNENGTKFWSNVLKAVFFDVITKDDEIILYHLTDVSSKFFNEPEIKFVIEFHFEQNEYFANRILSKTYYINCEPDPEEPLLYDGAEIYKCEGCRINWKNEYQLKESSFFEFFTPPELPEDVDDDEKTNIITALQKDFELGFYIKERVIPKAVMFFTGEIVDCQSSESESESGPESEERNEEESSINQN